MRIRMIFKNVGIILAALLLVAGCSTPQRIVVSPENLVTGSQLTLQVAPELTYLGEATEKGCWSDNTCYVMQESYLFGELDNTRYGRGVIITSLAFVDSGYSWSGAMFGENLKRQALEVGPARQDPAYQYMVLAPFWPFREYEVTFLQEQQYQVPQCALVKILGTQIGNSKRQFITYFEALPGCQAWQPGALTAEQQTVLDEFLQRSEESLLFQ